jgi:DNA-binding PadR family transcriptional regulator
MARSPRDLLTPAVLHILMALSDEPLHGYGVKRAVADQTGGRLRLGPGTLYEAIHRLEADAWIEEVPGPRSTGKPRRYYQTTEKGRARMEEELLRLRRVVGYAEDHALIPDPGV